MVKITAVVVALLGALALGARAGEAKEPAAKKKPAFDTAKAPNVTDPVKSLHAKFAKLDANHDGVIDAAERAAYEKKVSAGLDEKQAAEARAAVEAEFAREDASHDGKVSEAEFGSADDAAKK